MCTQQEKKLAEEADCFTSGFDALLVHSRLRMLRCRNLFVDYTFYRRTLLLTATWNSYNTADCFTSGVDAFLLYSRLRMLYQFPPTHRDSKPISSQILQNCERRHGVAQRDGGICASWLCETARRHKWVEFSKKMCIYIYIYIYIFTRGMSVPHVWMSPATGMNAACHKRCTVVRHVHATRRVHLVWDCWHDTFLFVVWRIHVWHEARICATWLKRVAKDSCKMPHDIQRYRLAS